MAKPSSIPKFLSSLVSSFTGTYDSTALSPFLQDAYKPKAKLYSDTERETMLRVANQSQSSLIDSQATPQSYFGALSRKNIQDTLDNERLIQMAPEISLAASVMVPSILAPNDMREGEIQFECDAEFLSIKQRAAVGDEITKFAENYFSLSTQLPKWIEEAMYRSGAQPFMVLPLSELYRKMTDPANIQSAMSTESFNNTLAECSENSLFGFGDTAENTSDTAICAGLESLDTDLVKQLQTVTDRKLESGKKSLSELSKLAKLICSTEKLSISDNIDKMTLTDAKNKTARKTLSDKVQLSYKVAEYDSVASGEDPTKDLTGHPLFVEWPTEAVIPIFTPGTPSDHIGYYVIEDEYGHPVDAMSDANGGGLFNNSQSGYANNPSNQNTITQLFQAYGFTQNQMYDQIPERQVMENIYQQIVENHLKNRAKQAGFADVSLGSDAALYRNMFNRFVQQRQTRLLFVPKEFMTYFCFKHSKYGTGVSKLDDLKWILSLRISLLTTRMLSAFKNAIDRRLIDINFDNKYPGNALQHMRTAQREAIDKELVTFSTLPEDTARLLAERSFSVKVSGVPGIPQYSITKDTDTRGQSTPPDQSLADDIKNLEYLGLEVPPAVMNNLNDAEFSRSVATTNIVFSRKLAVYQRIVCRYFSELIRNFIRFSRPLMDKLSAIVSDGKSKESAPEERGTVDAGKAAPLNRRMGEIIQSIHMVLPSPTMAPNSAQFDTLQKMSDSINALMEGVIPDDYAAGDTKLQAAISSYRAYAKANLLQTYAHRQGIATEDFPDFVQGFSMDNYLKIRQTLTNLAAGISRQDAAITKPSTDQQSDDAGMGGSMDTGAGGSFGDSGGGDDNTDNFDDMSGSDDTLPADTTTTSSPTPPSPDDTTSDTSDTTGTGESPDEGPTGKSLI